VSTTTGSPVKIDILANDSCVGTCDPASLTIGTSPSNGTAVRNADGTVTYTSAAGFAGTDSFTYTVRDTTTGTQVSNIATVTALVGAVTPPAKPTAVDDTATTPQNTVVGINVIANDTPCPPCTVAIASAPLHGTATANSPGAGLVTYQPAAGFTGADSFTYRATNAGGTSAPATVAVNVTPNAVTDIVTIATAKQKGTNLAVSGSVSAINAAFAQNVQLFTSAAATACTGTSLGTSTVGATGAWSFSVNPAPKPKLASVCVQSANGGFATAPVK